ncbi:hypothetical protein AMTR_s00043p00164970 [Amborella trichopoda]|uniref:Uncharacterized protein n=1 Tax=Amborella trichopoda TaxID=13333 RepID=W1PX31_AMBTC|nr:hypothetical protein AMTR_s00043p00164970 [Amborella trichopoda]
MIQSVVDTSWPGSSEAGGGSVATVDAPASSNMPSVQEVNSSSEESTPVNVRPVRVTLIAKAQAQEAGPSIVSSAEELALAPLPPSEVSTLIMPHVQKRVGLRGW